MIVKLAMDLKKKETWKKHPVASSIVAGGLGTSIGGIGLLVKDFHAPKRYRGRVLQLGGGLVAGLGIGHILHKDKQDLNKKHKAKSFKGEK